MPTSTYDLLTVASSSGGTVARGALTEQETDVRTKFGLAVSLGSLLARLSPKHQAHMLGLEFDVDPEAAKVAVRPTGLMAGAMRKQVERLQKTLAQAPHPVAVRDGGLVYNLYQPPVPSTRFIHHLARVALEGRIPFRPTTCTLQVTTRCQLNCAHCSAARFKTRDREELTKDELVSVIRQAEALGVHNIVFTGGEPLLRPDLFEIISSVNKDRAHAGMFSNGLLLTPETAKRLVEAGLHAVMISIDDPRPDTHNALRCVKGGFEQTTVGARNAVDAGLLVGISTYATPEDVHEGRVEQMVELAKSLGAHEITIFDTVPTGKLLPLEADHLLTEADKDKLVALEKRYNSLADYPHVITQAFINGPQGAGCFAGHAQFYMTAFGDITPCDFTPLTFGNIRDFSLLECWNKMLSHPAYQQRCNHCRMQDQEFRHKYIDDIPDDALLPWPAFDDLREQPHSPCAACEDSAGPLPAKVAQNS